MELIKKLTGKNPSEYEIVAKSLVDNSDVELFSKLVKQDDFLFDFIKENVAKRIQNACTKEKNGTDACIVRRTRVRRGHPFRRRDLRYA